MHLPLHNVAQVRTVTGFQPEGIHLTQWTSDQMLVSWQTGGEVPPVQTGASHAWPGLLCMCRVPYQLRASPTG